MNTSPFEFSRLIDLSAIGEEASLALEAQAQELEALTRRLKVEVRALKGVVTVALARDQVSHKVGGRFAAQVCQLCSQDLEPFEQELEEAFTVYFSPEEHPGVVLLDQEDQEFYAEPQVDVGEVMAQYLCLSLPAYPLCPAHQAQKPRGESIASEKKNPFDALGALLKG